MGAKDDQNATDSPPKVEVGEIDTRAPFQSVKDAVTLFGEGAFSGGKPAIRKRVPSSENILVKETQLHLSKKELNKLKDQLKNAETTKAQALIEIEIARRIVEDLTQKLRIVTKSKDSAIKSTETAKNQAKQIEETKSGDTPRHDGARKQDLESTREQYMTIFIKLASVKIKLWKVRHECDAFLEAKLVALNQAAEAEHATKVNVEKVRELSKEISTLQESIGQVRLASLQAHHEQAQIFVEKDFLKHSYEVILEASANKLLILKNEFDPKLACNLEKELTETMNEIYVVQKQMENVKALDLEYVRTVTLELDGAKELLQKVKEEESSLRSLLESLKLELENVKKEHSELKEKEAETESIVENMHVKLHKSKAKLEVALAEESKVRGASEEMISTLYQLSLEAENAQHEAEEMKYKAEELKREAEATRITFKEAEKKLRVVAEEAEEAKTTEKRALDQIKMFAERINVPRTSTSESGANITISREKFKALSRKVEESNTLTEMKVAVAIAKVEVVKASENEAVKRFETIYKEIEDMKVATQGALKRAEMDEAAKKAIEGELLRWHGQEQGKAVENLSPILVKIEKSLESSPRHYRIQKQNPTPHKVEVQNLEKKKKFVFKKANLPNISNIFHRKKKQIEGGSSSSYLPDPSGSHLGSASNSFQNDAGFLNESASSSEAEFGFSRPEFRQSPLAGSVQFYERHVFLCYKKPSVWPPRIEAAEFDRLPRLLSAAVLARKGDMKKETRLTICEGHDGTETSNGDVLIFPDMIRYRRLTHFDVDTFVEEVLVKDGEWLPGTPEILKGFYVFVCSHGSRDRRCGVCGPAVVSKFKEEIELHGLQGKVSVSPCSHIGGHKYAGNVIIFGSSINGVITGHWYGYVTPDDVTTLLEQHIGKGEIIDWLWRGQMGLSEEEQIKSLELRLQLNGETDAGNNTKKLTQTQMDEASTGIISNKVEVLGCCQQNGKSCCQNPVSPQRETLDADVKGVKVSPEKKKSSKRLLSRINSGKGLSIRRICAMPTWSESWEREDTYAALAVACAAVSVAVAYSCYKQLR